MESQYVYKLIDQIISNLRTAGLIPNLDILRPFLALLPEPQRSQLQALLDVFDQINNAISNFQNNFDINVSKSCCFISPFLQSYALTVITMYADRFNTYVKDLKPMNRDFITFTNQVADYLGYDYPATFSLPLQQAMQPLYFLRLFLDQVALSMFVNSMFPDFHFCSCGAHRARSSAYLLAPALKC